MIEFSDLEDLAVQMRTAQSEVRQIRWLPGNGIPGIAIGQLPEAVRVLAADLLRGLELDQAAKGVSGKLAKEASLGTLNTIGAGTHCRYPPLALGADLWAAEVKSAKSADLWLSFWRRLNSRSSWRG